MLEQDYLTLMLTTFAGLIGLAVLVIGGIAFAAKTSSASTATTLLILGAGGFAFAALAAAYGEMNTQIALSRVGPASLAVTAPSRIETLTSLSLGFLIVFVALSFRVMITRRSRLSD